MSSAIKAVNPFANLEIGKVPLGKIIRFTPSELIRLYKNFYQELFGVKVLFSKKFMPDMAEVGEGFSLLVCVPDESILPAKVIHTRITNFFDFNASLATGQHKHVRGNYIVATSIASKTINPTKDIVAQHWKVVTFLEAQLFWLFSRWLAGSSSACSNLVLMDIDSMIVTSSQDSKGASIILDCLNKKVFSKVFPDPNLNFKAYEQTNEPNLFRTRPVIRKH
jgi:hypothetical protein